uniref:Uncharacterized protein n=1 Tax=Triticum urartu TaxID=4572 RepID=A0A8R7R3F4_TRIUA
PTASFGSTPSRGTPALSTSLPRERFPDLVRSGRKSSKSDDADSTLPSLCLRQPPAPPAKSFSPRRRCHPLPPAKILCQVMATV